MAALQAEIREHEPVTALEAGEDGLDVVRALLVATEPVTTNGAQMLIEIGAGQAVSVVDFATRHTAWQPVAVYPDLDRVERVAHPSAYLTQPQLGEQHCDGEEKQPRCERLLKPLQAIRHVRFGAALWLGRRLRNEIAFAGWGVDDERKPGAVDAVDQHSIRTDLPGVPKRNTVGFCEIYGSATRRHDLNALTRGRPWQRNGLIGLH